jgi:hypothetical protein
MSASDASFCASVGFLVHDIQACSLIEWQGNWVGRRKSEDSEVRSDGFDTEKFDVLVNLCRCRGGAASYST